MTMFTIGYGGRSRDEVLAPLVRHGIRTVVDVRLRPDRAHMGIWVKARTPDKGIERWLGDAGIGYLSAVELGNLFLDRPDWPQRYADLLARAGDLLVARLDTLEGPYCLLCAERLPHDCHRRILAEYLSTTRGVEVVHL